MIAGFAAIKEEKREQLVDEVIRESDSNRTEDLGTQQFAQGERRPGGGIPLIVPWCTALLMAGIVASLTFFLVQMKRDRESFEQRLIAEQEQAEKRRIEADERMAAALKAVSERGGNSLDRLQAFLERLDREAQDREVERGDASGASKHG